MSARYGKEAHSRDEDARAAKDAPDAVEANLDDRKAAVLRAIIEQYVASAQPVGSATVTRSADTTPSPEPEESPVVLERVCEDVGGGEERCYFRVP